MALVINHNLMAMNASRNLSSSYGALAVSTRRLSSGLRVGTAADDAAGLAIRELMRADISSLQQGIRNANDAISLIQTADGALQIIDEKLIRMKELATQAATGTYNSDQRLIIDSEYQAMASEITRIANATDFNGIHLLNGNLSGDNTTHNGHRPGLHRPAEDPLRHRQRLRRGLLLHRHRNGHGLRPRPRPLLGGQDRHRRRRQRGQVHLHPGPGPGRPGGHQPGHHLQGQDPREPRFHAEPPGKHHHQPDHPGRKPAGRRIPHLGRGRGQRDD
jgi:Flagellin and related hook-associated proteins